jgi:outer membrane protein assembly factor BamB
MKHNMMRLTFAIAVLATPLAAADDAPWSTYRGNNRRTGNTDNVAGPAKPEVLWFVKSTEHYATAPVPCGSDILFPGLGAFNSGVVNSIPMSPKDVKAVKPTWTKAAPLVRLPTVSSPAVVDGKIVFGDGMHQTDGSVLYCLPADGGHLLWALQVPGTLVHMEGSPAVSKGRVYVGGGAAGVMCVDLNTVTLDGKELSVKEMPAMQAAHWKKLQAKFEEEKKKDPDFAVPPTENDLLKPSPKAIWKQGEKRWHCDAPLLIAGDKVLVASAFLDKEKEGERALFCLNAADGKEIWKAPLTYNPWGGPTLAGDTVIVTTSTIPYDPKEVEGAKGEVIAIDLADGKEKWKKAVPGGVIGCAAATADAAIFTCTDGKLRAFDIKDGSRKMIYDAKAPFFAPPAVVGDVAYVADLKGIVHAVDVKTGVATWTLDLGAEPLKLPGMNYGGITVHGGKLFLATCNLEGAYARQPTCVLCIGSK